MSDAGEKPEAVRDDLGWWKVGEKLPDEGITVRIYGRRPMQTENYQAKGFLEDGSWYDAETDFRMIVSHWQELPADPADPVDAGSFLEQPVRQEP